MACLREWLQGFLDLPYSSDLNLHQRGFIWRLLTSPRAQLPGQSLRSRHLIRIWQVDRMAALATIQFRPCTVR